MTCSFDMPEMDGMEFLRRVAEKGFECSVIESSVQLAKKLGLKTVGEGVETRDDWMCLKQAGCCRISHADRAIIHVLDIRRCFVGVARSGEA